MAEFCKQCAAKVWGRECPGDFVGITTKEMWDEGKATIVMCEGCGPCQVTPEGECTGNCENPSHDGCVADFDCAEHEWKNGLVHTGCDTCKYNVQKEAK